MEQGKIITIEGDKPTISTILISLSVKLQKSSKVLFIDSANCFNPSFVQKHYQQNTKLILDNIMIARPFTPKQLKNLIEKLKDSFPEEAKVLFISSINELFYDNEIGDIEFSYIFKKLLIDLEILTQKNNITTILGFSNKKHQRTQELQKIAIKKSDFWSRV